MSVQKVNFDLIDDMTLGRAKMMDRARLQNG